MYQRYQLIVPVLKKTRQYNFSLTSVDLNNSLINYDATLLITDHDDLDYKTHGFVVYNKEGDRSLINQVEN